MNRLDQLPRDATALPPLPIAFHAALDDGLAAASVELAPDARAAIDRHVRLLLAWNRAINLTSITDPVAIAVRHVLDSLTAMPLLGPPEDLLGLVDLGSGGGFPGLPLTAARPGTYATLVDSVAKKAAFLEAAIAASGLGSRARVAAARAETLATRRGARTGARTGDVVTDDVMIGDVVTARAVDSLDGLVELALPLLRVGGRLIAWKRGDIALELEAGRRAAAALGGGPPTVHAVAIPGLADHLLVEVRKLRPTPAGYPRSPVRREREAW